MQTIEKLVNLEQQLQPLQIPLAETFRKHWSFFEI